MSNPSSAWKNLLTCAGSQLFERHDIAAQMNARGRYEVALDTEFPLLIKLFHFTSDNHTRGATWHERLELFLPLDGPARFRMGTEILRLKAGDLLVVDNLKLHHVVDFPGFDTRVIVISFLPNFIYSLGSPSHDYSFLLPFYTRAPRQSPVLSSGQAAAQPVYASIQGLLERYFVKPTSAFREAGCKAALLECLFHLARHFRHAEVARLEFLRHQEHSLQLKKLFDHINQAPAQKLSVPAAARLVGMSPVPFMKMFKKVSGMTLVAYLNHVRLKRAAQLLREGSRSVAEIALECGFSDQSYLDRLFKRAFSVTPKEFRRQAVAPRTE